MAGTSLQVLIEGITCGEIVPYLGPGVLQGAVNRETGEPIPADSDSLILAMNGGKPMAPRLMVEFPRAAMDVELKRGRSAVIRFLDSTYGNTRWSRSPFHDWIASVKPGYVIDINRDTQLQQSYAQTPHTLIRGISRIAGTDYRFRIHTYDGEKYSKLEVDQRDIDPALPILFKPMGSPTPDAGFIASDADYVDYISELMGGFAIPDFVKTMRREKQYLFAGLRMTRDTERMVLSELIYAAGTPAGWALIPTPNDKERRFCEKMEIQLVEADIGDLLTAATVSGKMECAVASAQDIGC